MRNPELTIGMRGLPVLRLGLPTKSCIRAQCMQTGQFLVGAYLMTHKMASVPYLECTSAEIRAATAGILLLIVTTAAGLHVCWIYGPLANSLS